MKLWPATSRLQFWSFALCFNVRHILERKFSWNDDQCFTAFLCCTKQGVGARVFPESCWRFARSRCTTVLSCVSVHLFSVCFFLFENFVSWRELWNFRLKIFIFCVGETVVARHLYRLLCKSKKKLRHEHCPFFFLWRVFRNAAELRAKDFIHAVVVRKFLIISFCHFLHYFGNASKRPKSFFVFFVLLLHLR